MAESSGSRHGPQWRDALVSGLRALRTRLDVPPAAEQATTVRQRLEAQQRPQARPPLIARWRPRILNPLWRAALIVALTVAGLAVAIPQSRAVIAHVLRLDGVELRQAPGPSPAPHPSLPGEQRMPLEQARQRVAFPILVPAKLGRPDAVTVSDGGRVATLIYDRTPYGQVRLDEFDGHLDPVYFELRPPGQRHRGPADHRQHADLGCAADRPAPGGRLRQGGRARGRRLRPLTERCLPGTCRRAAVYTLAKR